MNLRQAIGTLTLMLCASATPASGPNHAAESAEFVADYPRFVPRPGIQVEQRGNLQITSVLAAGGAPYPGTLFSILREEPDAYGKTRLTVLATSGPHAHSNFKLSPGRYLVQARNGAVTVEQGVEVPPSGVLRQLVVLNAGELHLSSSMDEAGEPAEGTWFRVLRADTDSFGRSTRIQVAGNGYSQSTKFLLPAGEYIAEASYGDARTELPIRIEAAGQHQHNMLLNAGRLELFSTLVHEGERIGGTLISVHHRQKDKDGDEHWTELTRAEHTDGITFVLPQGDYLARASLDQAQVEIPVQVTAAQTQVYELPLNAGEVRLQTALQGHPEPLLNAWFHLQSEAPSDQIRDAPGPVKSAQGKARFIVPAGRYLARAGVGEGEGDLELEVDAGTSQAHIISLEAGRVTLRMAANEDKPPYPDNWFSIYRAELDAHGQELRRRVFNKGYYTETAVVLPAGRYLVLARNHQHKGQRVFTISSGEVNELTIIANP